MKQMDYVRIVEEREFMSISNKGSVFSFGPTES